MMVSVSSTSDFARYLSTHVNNAEEAEILWKLRQYHRQRRQLMDRVHRFMSFDAVTEPAMKVYDR
jgi:hypothetical protein